jgi:hypothetical protein
LPVDPRMMSGEQTEDDPLWITDDDVDSDIKSYGIYTISFPLPIRLKLVVSLTSDTCLQRCLHVACLFFFR